MAGKSRGAWVRLEGEARLAYKALKAMPSTWISHLD